MRGRGSKLGKFEKHVLFELPILISSLKFISRGLIFANSPLLKNFAWINFREKPQNSRNREI